MSRTIRSEFAANVAMREAAQTFPRTASVRLLHVAKRQRDKARERAARLATCGLLPAIGALLFSIATR